MFQPLIEVAFLLVYSVLLNVVVPYIRHDKDNYGVLMPGALAISFGSVFWTLFTWLGLSSDDGWIWGLTMVLMPVAMFYALTLFGRGRSAGKYAFVDNFGAKSA